MLTTAFLRLASFMQVISKLTCHRQPKSDE